MTKNLAQLKGTIQHWIFDLDNTLYPYELNLFSQIEKRMTEFVEKKLSLPTEEARELQKKYFYQHGTTLRGLMDCHGIHPDEFLAAVHDIDYSVLPANPMLAEGLAKLSGQKYIFTNGNHAHIEMTLKQLAIALDSFHGLVGIEKTHYIPKPHPVAFEHFVRHNQPFDAKRALLVDDLAANLKTAKDFGMTTVWMKGEAHPLNPTTPDLPDYIDFQVEDINQLMEAVLA